MPKPWRKDVGKWWVAMTNSHPLHGRARSISIRGHKRILTIGRRDKDWID